MQPKIVHESEVHRQHIRLKIPIQAEVDGVRYQVDDWSVTGFGVENVLTSRRPGERFPVKLIFAFEEFDLTMRFDSRLVYGDRDHGRFGCAFLGQSQAQREVFRYLVDAYLAGEVVSAGDLLQMRARDNTAAARVPAVSSPLTETERRLGRLRRYGARLGFSLAALALLALVGLGIEQRFFSALSTSAMVDAPTVQIRAPIAGQLSASLEVGQRVAPGTPLATLSGLDGTVLSLESPCDCVVLEQAGLDGQHYPAGEPLLVLAEADRPLLILARLPLDAVEHLRIGDRAEIRVPGQAELRYGQIERIEVRARLEASPDPGALNPVARPLAQVLVRPDRPFELADFGALVTVSFP